MESKIIKKFDLVQRPPFIPHHHENPTEETCLDASASIQDLLYHFFLQRRGGLLSSGRSLQWEISGIFLSLGEHNHRGLHLGPSHFSLLPKDFLWWSCDIILRRLEGPYL